MTCIAGVVGPDGTIYMGGDSAGIAGYDLVVRADQKVFTKGPMVFGFAGSFRMGQILRYALTVPAQTEADVEQYLATTFIDAVRQILREKGSATRNNELESNEGQFLVGYQGRLFRIDHDYQVGEAHDDFVAIGCGDAIAQGALHATPDLEPRARLRRALAAAERYSAGVRRPFVVKTLVPEKKRR